MAKKSQSSSAPTATRSPKSATTLRRKAKRVIQSSGVQFFKEWMNASIKSGRRPTARSAHPRLCDDLIRRYEAKGRKMDLPKVEEDAPKGEEG